MLRGVALVGRIVDETGAPVSGATLNLRLEDAPPPAVLPRWPMMAAKTDSQGNLGPANSPLTAGEWKVIAVHPDYEVVRPRYVRIEPDQLQASLALVVRRPVPQPEISGVLRDEAGRPMGNISLHAQQGTESVSTSTRANGSFKFTPQRSGRPRTKIRTDLPVSVVPYAEHGLVVIDPRPVTWGTRNLVVTVRRPSPIELRVVEAGTGAPVEAYDVRLFPDNCGSEVQNLRAPGTHPKGIVRLENVARGRSQLYVYPKDPDLVPSGTIDCEVVDGTPLRVELQRRVPLTVRVVRLVEGKEVPVAGTEVQLVRREGAHGTIDFETISGTPDEPFERFWTDGTVAVILDRGRSDADGRLVLRGPVARDLYLKLLGPGHVPQLESSVRIRSPRDERTVRVRLGASLRVRLRPEPIVRELGSLAGAIHGPWLIFSRSLSPGPGWEWFPAMRVHSSDPGIEPRPPGNGEFEVTALPAGTWEARILVAARHGSSRRRDMSLPLATIEGLVDGETRDVTLDVSSLAPARLVGQLQVDGEPAPGVKVYLGGQRTVADAASVYQPGVETVTGAGGRFEVDVLPAVHRLQARIGPNDINGEAWPLPDATPVTLGPGARVEHVFSVQRTRLRVKLLAAEDRSIAGRDVRLLAPEMSFYATATTDAQGVATFDSVPAGTMKAITWNADLATEDRRRGRPGHETMPIELGRLVVPRGAKELERELRLPQGSW